ncbi:unnamed protein product [Orchesella dallaii]|uniref:Gustatory receptor n=1 Tax=Orchesella dallaii TaxID=48710 RepID=A0ABP1R2C1_9HEXA
MEHYDQPSAHKELQSMAEKDLVSLLFIPLRCSQIYGVFPLSLASSKLEMTLSWKIYIFPVFNFLLFMTPSIFSTLHGDDLEAIFKLEGNTDRTAQTVVNIAAGWVDLVCLVIVIRNRLKIKAFYSEFTSTVVNLLAFSYECDDSDKQATSLKRHISRMRTTMVFILLLTTAAFLNSGTFYMGIAWKAGYSWLKLYVVFLLIVYWIVMNQVRLLTFYFWIAMIISFKVGFGSLRILINSVAHENDANNFRTRKLFPSSDRITWIVAKYHEMEKLLEEFHNLFGGHLINFCFTSLLPMINICFQLVRLPVASQQAMSWAISGSATLVAVLISSAVTFCNLCDASTAMADEAIGCITDFRDLSSSLPVVHYKILDEIFLFFTSTLSHPPKISPGNFFTVGRQLLPPVIGLMTTYLIVLQQFRLEESLDQ